jgi:DNA-binding NarL/FixJ family response regulator
MLVTVRSIQTKNIKKMRPIRVILFEDSLNLRTSLYYLINGSPGLECVGAYPNCNDIMDHLEKDKPDVVVMDIQMPGMNGIEAVQIIREKYPDLKIMMQTIFEDSDKIFQSIYAGASGYVLKNTHPSRFLEFIKETHEGGAPMSPSVATKVLKMVASQQKPRGHDFNLSGREKEILTYLVDGMSYKMIADECFISIDTVRAHIKNLYEKLHVHSKGEAVAKAIKGNIV